MVAGEIESLGDDRISISLSTSTSQAFSVRLLFGVPTTTNSIMVQIICFLALLPCIHALVTPSSRFLAARRRISRPVTFLSSSSKGEEEFDSLKVDESKLSPSEVERLQFIKKLSLEADEIVKAAGFNIDESSDGDMVDRAIRDTKWAGQSDVEETRVSKNNWSDVISRKGLAAGDLLSLLAFAAIGRSNHGEGVDIAGIVTTAAPFLLSWFLVSPLLGSYSRSATSSKGGAPVGLLAGWAVSMPIAVGLRGLVKGEMPPTPFIVVSMVATLTILSLWRVLYVSLVGGTSDKEFKSAGAFEVFKMIGTLVKRW